MAALSFTDVHAFDGNSVLAVRAVPQVDFLDYVISPMFSLLTQVLTGIDEYVKVIKLNRANYKGALFFPFLSLCLRSPFLSLSR